MGAYVVRLCGLVVELGVHVLMTEQWLTYSEVAEALGIQVQSVRKRRQRFGWQSRTDNQTGKTEVLVDLDVLKKRKPSKP